MYGKFSDNTLNRHIIDNMNNISDIKRKLMQATAEQTTVSFMLSAFDQCEHMKFLVKLS